MTYLMVPRSRWPPKCHRVSAWHKDEHIGRLLKEEDALVSAHRLGRQQNLLPSKTIRELVKEAVATASVYRATAAMDLLYDAHESYAEILDAFALAAQQDPKAYQRVSCCIGFLRLGQNRREILGKYHQEIMADGQHFRALAARAQDLLKSLEAG